MGAPLFAESDPHGQGIKAAGGLASVLHDRRRRRRPVVVIGVVLCELGGVAIALMQLLAHVQV
jgi:hypothetical protein